MAQKRGYRQSKGRDLFEDDLSRNMLSELGNVLEKICTVFDFERFRNILEDKVIKDANKTGSGRPPYDPILLLKILFLQRFYNLSDHQVQYQICDRNSFQRFLGIQSVQDVPDEKTVWYFREKLSKNNVFEDLFDEFNRFLFEKGILFTSGKIVDASFIEAPKQRNTHEENKAIKEGKGSKLWKDNPHKKAHKDIDARWAKKRDETHYGYKGHVKVDAQTKLVESLKTTPANIHDSKVVDQLITDSDANQDVYLDAGYVGRDQVITDHGANPHICEKGTRGHPLTDDQKKANSKKSKIRCRVEHVFGFIEESMKGSTLRSIGLIRAKANFAFTCLVYNLNRYIQIQEYHHEFFAPRA